MRRGAASCRLPWRGNGIVPGVRLQEAAVDREVIGMRTPENAEASMADINTVLLRSAVGVAIASLSFGGPFARRGAYDIPVERLKAMEAHFAA